MAFAPAPVGTGNRACLNDRSQASVLSRDGVRWWLEIRVQVKALLDRLDCFRGGRETGEDVE